MRGENDDLEQVANSWLQCKASPVGHEKSATTSAAMYSLQARWRSSVVVVVGSSFSRTLSALPCYPAAGRHPGHGAR